MAYELQVCRTGGARISEAEWRRYVAGNPELTLEEELVGRSQEGGDLRVPSPAGARWGPHHIGWRRGSLRVALRGEDVALLRFLAEVAQALGARVEGEEGEVYDADGRVVG